MGNALNGRFEHLNELSEALSKTETVAGTLKVLIATKREFPHLVALYGKEGRDIEYNPSKKLRYFQVSDSFRIYEDGGV